MIKALYISSVPSFAEFERIASLRRPGVQHVTYGMSESGFKFHTLIMDGLDGRDDCEVLSLVGRSVSRSMYRGGYWHASRERRSESLEIRHVGFLNAPFVKQVQIAVSIFGHTLRWLWKNRNEENRFVIMDASYITVIPAVLLATAATGARTAAIFADIYSYMGRAQDAREESRLVHRILQRVMPRVYGRLDLFVLLTEQMNALVNRTGKPHIVMEGLVDFGMTDRQNSLEEKSRQPTIMYAGALRKQYGLEMLLNGFLMVQDPSIRLEIYGGGDYSTAIEDAALGDRRISYCGTIPNSEVVEREMRAWILVNPRPANSEFAKYSFPSKNMEYMASGTPLLTTRLPGMPIEYLDYVSTIDGDDAAALAAAIERELARDPRELHEQGERAKAFVLARKSNVIQSARILEAMENCR